MNFGNMRTGAVVCEPSMSLPMPSRLKPGWECRGLPHLGTTCPEWRYAQECALHKYPIGGQVWLFMRPVGEKSWSPVREATEADVRAFASAGKLL